MSLKEEIETFLCKHKIIFYYKMVVVDLMESLTLVQYRKMVDEVIDFKKHHGEMPKYTTVDGCRIDRDDYIDMIERVNKFFLEMGRNPKRVEIGNTGNNYTPVGKVLPQ